MCSVGSRKKKQKTNIRESYAPLRDCVESNDRFNERPSFHQPYVSFCIDKIKTHTHKHIYARAHVHAYSYVYTHTQTSIDEGRYGDLI